MSIQSIKILNLGLSLLFLGGIASTAAAQVSYDSGGFEQPGFVPGGLLTQDGWIHSSPGVVNEAVVTAGAGTLGSQGVVLTDIGTLQFVVARKDLNQMPTSPLIVLEGDMNIASDFDAGVSGPQVAFSSIYFDLETTDGNWQLHLFSVFAESNPFVETGYILERSQGVDFFQSGIATDVVKSEFRSFRIEIDNPGGTLTGFVNDVQVGQLSVASNWVTEVNLIGIYMNRRQGSVDQSSVTFDNVRTYGAVPEPASVFALAMGLGALARRKKRAPRRG